MAKTHLEIVGIVLSAGLTLHVSGCAPGDVEADAARSAETSVVEASNPAIWEAISPSGTSVTVTATPYPVRVGDMSFHIEFGQAVPDSVPVSVDIVSPEMPMMGIRRYAARRMANGDYMVAAPIMMDGLWELYVNLGVGADAALFEFEAEPGEEGAGHDGQDER
ncbi:MAG: FixH family protein [Longimicrobiales bacterium]